MAGRQDPDSGGRAAQRRRTRAAIVAAAQQLVASGSNPSIDDIATAADVSRRTIYMYFPTVDQLLLDATAGLLTADTVDAIDYDRYGDDAVARVDALVRAIVERAPATLHLGRTIIRLTVDAPRTDDGARRGYRRVAWIERAVEPLRTQLRKHDYERLVSALSVLLGWEAMIVLQDVRGLDTQREGDTLRWSARALVERALADATTR